MSRGRLNIATCLVTGSIETTISVSVLYVPSLGRWSVPISRMLSCSWPSHGGIETFGHVAADRRSGSGSVDAVGRSSPGAGRRVDAAFLGRLVADEDAAALEEVEGEHVVAGDDDVAAGHDQDDRQEPGDRQRVAREPGGSQAAVAGGAVAR